MEKKDKMESKFFYKLKSLFISDTFTLNNGKVVKEKFNPTIYIILSLSALVLIAAEYTDFDFGAIIKRGHYFTDILVKMFPPSIDYAKTVYGPLIDTLTMSVVGTMIGVIFALPMAFLNSSNIIKNKYLISTLRFILSLLRTIPVLVYALISVYIFGIGTFAGTVAIAIFTFSIASKMLYEQIETVDMGPYEALESTGASMFKSIRYAIYPQIQAYYYSMILYNFEMNVRSAAILGYVGAGGIGIILNETLGWKQYQDTALVLIALIIVVTIIEAISRKIREILN